MGLFIHGLRNSVFLSAGLASASLMCASIDSARAQTGGPANSLNAGAGNGAADGSALEEVVVTARKREERLIDVPVAVTGISAETLSQVPTTSLTQLGNLVPGVSLERMGGGSSGAAFTIRGVGQLAADYNSEQPVALNIDGVQITKGPAAQIAFFDLQSVEVLKGPQSLFFGKNSPAGVVGLTSASPGSTLEGYARVGYEFSASSPSFEGAISIPLSDTLSVRIAGHYDHDNSGYIKNEARPIANPFEPTLPLPGASYTDSPLNRNGVGRVTVAWRPDSSFDATLKVLGSYHHDDNGSTEEVFTCGANTHPAAISLLNPAAAFADPYGECRANHVISNGMASREVTSHFYGGPADGKPFTETKVGLSSLQMNYHFSEGLELSSVTGWYHSSHGAFDNYDLTVYAQALDAETDRDTQISQELRLASSYSGPINFTAGAYYEHDKHDVTNTDKVFGLGPFPGPGQFNGIYNTVAMEAADKAESYSVFGQISWKMLDNVELAGGARYSHDTKSARIQNVFNYFDLLAPIFGIPNPFSPAGVAYTPSVSASNVSPEVTLTWHPVQNVTVYGAFKTGYLAAGVGNPANVSNYSQLPDPNSTFIYKAEKVNGFEAGVKGLWLDNRLEGDATIYRYEYKDLQVATFHPDTLSFSPGNAGKARNQGVEVQGTFKVTRDFRLRGSLTYTDLKFLEYRGAQCYPGQSVAQCPDGTQDLSGTKYGDGPFTAKFGFIYEHGLWGDFIGGLGADVTHTTASPTYERDPLAFTPSYTMVNASLRIFQGRGPWEFDVIGTNLNNGIYYKNFIFKPLGLPDDIAVQSVSLPRQISARLEYKF
jgi:outer membrane receptor protein involved in Fe transport